MIATVRFFIGLVSVHSVAANSTVSKNLSHVSENTGRLLKLGTKRVDSAGSVMA